MRCTFTKHNCPDCGKHYDEKPPEICECGKRLRCARNAVIGINFCANHGGGSGKRRGIIYITPKPSRTSNNVLVRETYKLMNNITKNSTFKSQELAARYEAAMNDPELVALRKPLALLDARIWQLLQRVEDGITTELWQTANKTYDALKSAIRSNDDLEIQAKISDLDAIFKRVEDDYKSWEQVLQALELQRRTSESERKRLLEMKQFLTAQEAMDMVKALAASVYQNVTDEVTIRKIIYDFTRITGSSHQTVSGRSDSPSGSDERPD